MKKNAKMMIIGLTLAVIGMYSGVALAASGSATGSGNEANVDLRFNITIPKFVYFSIDLDDIYFTSSISNDENGALSPATASVQVTYFTNDTSTHITSSGTLIEHVDDPTSTIDWDRFTVTGPAGFTPDSVEGANFQPTATGSYTTRYVNQTWEYTFTPLGTDYKGGDYLGTLTYTITVP